MQKAQLALSVSEHIREKWSWASPVLVLCLSLAKSRSRQPLISVRWVVMVSAGLLGHGEQVIQANLGVPEEISIP